MKNVVISTASWFLIIGVCAADSIRIGETHYEDVYIAEAYGRYYVHSSGGKLLADVSNKRFDVKDVLINREDPDRKAFFEKLKGGQPETATTNVAATRSPESYSKVLGDPDLKNDEHRKAREEYNALMKRAAEAAEARKPLLEKAAADAQKREAQRPIQDRVRAEQDKARWAAESSKAPTYKAPAYQTPTYQGTTYEAQGKVNDSLVATMKQEWAATGMSAASRDEKRKAIVGMVLIADTYCKTPAEREATLDYIQNQIAGW